MAKNKTPPAKAQTKAKPAPKPLQQAARPTDPCTLVIFGASGDLAHRLVVPALYNLARTGLLPDDFAVIGVSRSEETGKAWSAGLYKALKGSLGDKGSDFDADGIDEAVWKRLAKAMDYIAGDVADAALYDKLSQAIGPSRNAIFYLAIADRLFAPVVEQLGKAGLTVQDSSPGKPAHWRRVVIEKPFGHSLDSARALNAQILQSLQEDQIFRIDHFLGKDTVQSIMAFRFANGLFEPLWNRDRIDHVQITASETLGVEKRGEFYEATGALRDMAPNHLLSLVSMVAMEPPVGFDAAEIRSKKAEVFAAMPAAEPGNAVRGQYGPGDVLGKRVQAYRNEPDVAKDSQVETYVAMKLEIDNWRWAGVPFYIRTGKHLSRRVTEIAIRFKQAPYAAFKDTPIDALKPNWLVLSIAPDEGISLQFEVKRPGPTMDLAPVRMDFRYDDWFPKEPNVGYETLLYDVMTGDQTLFMRADMAEQGWRIMQPVLDAWAAAKADFPNYDSGGDGPRAADDLLARDGARAWRPLGAPAKPV